MHYLFINSDEFRRLFANQIAPQLTSSTMLPAFSNGIVCKLEVSNIDLLVESDNCFLAIENKLWARFQDQQPSKYCEVVENYSKAKFEEDPSRYRIVVVAPKQRASEIEQHLDEQEAKFHEKPIKVFWQDIQVMLQKLEGKASRRVQVVAELLNEFIEQQIGQHVDLKFDRNVLLGPEASITNQFQAEFLYLIKSSFSDFSPSRMGFGKGTYAGFYFNFPNSQRRNWFGFHSSRVGTELRFHADLDTTPPNTLSHWQVSGQQGNGQSVLLHYNSDRWPSNRMEWQDVIDPALELLNNNTHIAPESDIDN